jgi:hypothetical protein
VLVGLLRAPGDQAERGLGALGHKRQVRRHVEPGGVGEGPLDQTVLEGVVDSTTTRPPTPITSIEAGMARRSTASSSLTAIRRAWKVRLAGWPPVRRAGAGIVA